MKKQTFGIILAAALTAGSLFGTAQAFPQGSLRTVYASTSNNFGSTSSSKQSRLLSLVEDQADLLTDDEESQLLDKLDTISEENDFDVAVATVQSTDGVAMNKFTDDFYDDNHYGTGETYDGILFMVSIGDREWHITTHGFARAIFDKDALDDLKEIVQPELKAQDFAGAFNAFADQCQYVLESSADMDSSDVSAYADGDYDDTYSDNSGLSADPLPIKWIPISLGIGLVLAFLCTMGMRAQLKSVRSKDSAVDYVRPGSMDVTRSNDIFLYHTVTRTAKPKDDDNSSTGGSDSSHGGTGGSF